MPANVFTNYPAVVQADSVNVLLLDWLNTQPQDQPYVRSQILKYLRNAPHGRRMAIFSLGSQLRMVRGFTTDLSVLIAAANDPKSAAKGQVSPLLPTSVEDEADRQFVSFLTQSGASAAAIDAIQGGTALTSGTQQGSRLGLTIEAFHELERFLAPIPGRKNVLWFAGSFPMSAFPQGAAGKFEQEYRDVSGMLASGKIAIYPVSSEGLNTGRTYDAQCANCPSAEEENSNRSANQMAMEGLARDTGGQAFYNANGLSDVIERVTTEGERYYTLAYVSDDRRMDGAYRSIQVKLKEGDYKLAYRRGYYAANNNPVARPTPATPGTMGDPLLELMKFGLPDLAQIVYKVRVMKVQREPNAPLAGSNMELKEPVTRYAVDFSVSTVGLNFQKENDGTYHGDLRVTVIGYDKDGRPLNLNAGQMEMSLAEDAYSTARKIGLQVHAEIDLPEDAAYLSTGVYDLISGKAGTLAIPLTANSPAH